MTLGLRPEHCELAASGGAFSLKVDLVEALGADTLAHGRIGGGGPELTVRLPGSLPVAEGDALPLKISADHLHLFDPETGARI